MSEAVQPLPNGAVPAAPPPPVVAPVEAPKPDQLSPKFAALARKEQEAVRRMQAAKTLEQQVKAEREATAVEQAKIAEFRKLLKENPMQALQMEGLTYEQLTQVMLNNGQITPEMQHKRIQERIDAVEAERRREKEEAAESAKAQAAAEEQELVKDFQGQIGEHIKTNATKYPLTNLYGRADMVYYVIDQHYLKAKEIMEIPKAAEIVEQHLRQEVKKAETVLKPEPAPASVPSKRFSPPPQEAWVEKPLKTLSNDVTPGVPAAATPSHFLTDEERIRNALARVRARGRPVA